MRSCLKVTNAVLAQLPSLRAQRVNLSSPNITDTGLGMHLQHLDLIHCTNITDAGLAHLAGMPLQRLDLIHTTLALPTWLPCLGNT